MKYDAIIIGGGIAGLSTAIHLKEQNLNVLVVSKTYPTHSQSTQAQGGINAVIYEDTDSIDKHIEDTYNASKGLSNKSNIEKLCSEAKETIKYLDQIGVPFTRDVNNKIAQRKFGGTKAKRTCYSSDYSGLKIIHTLHDKCINENVDFLNEHLLIDLIIENETCNGVVLYDILNGEIKILESNNIVLATGGYAGIYYNHTTNSYANSADGLAIAFKNGVKLSNMEFVQFHPTALIESNILISESARGEGGYLVDCSGNRFIDELKSRDEISKVIYEKKLNQEKVYLDLRHINEKIDELIPQERDLALHFANTDIKKDLLEINPASHYTMGGILTDINGKTNIKNLYACGECSQANIHGANRLGGNSLLEVCTISKFVAQYIIDNLLKEFTSNIDLLSVKEKYQNKIKEIIDIEPELNFYEYKIKLGDILFENVGIKRDTNSLSIALDFVDDTISKLSKMGLVDKSINYNKNLIDFLEFKNMLLISKNVITCALNRKESRGAHNRIDYDFIDQDYNKNSYIQLINEIVELGFEDIK